MSRYILCIVGLALISPVAAQEVDFSRDIRSILSENCYHCHGPDAKSREGDLRLDTRQGLFREGENGLIVTPGKSDQSDLIRRVFSSDEDEQMPPSDSKLKLTDQQRQLLKKWVDSGAQWRGHWSFEPVKKPAVPSSVSQWPVNEIDHHVLARLKQHKLTPSPPATKQRLLRRVSFDLTGLPPTLQQLDDFQADLSPEAYEKVVDRLLASPTYGERMAWDWLDAARYADSNGFQGDGERTMWPWRSWVIRSLNANMPFDQFTVKQLAGDLLPDATLEDKLATGFCRNHMINGEGGRIAEENRIEYLFDQTETMGTVWLGLTLTCSRCHDHKYDPVLQSEYYSLAAFFNQTSVNGRGGNPQTPPVVDVVSQDQQKRRDDLNQRIAAITSEIKSITQTRSSEQQAWEAKLLQGTASPNWNILQPSSTKATHQTLTVQPDKSILAGGPNPKNDTYTIETTSKLTKITGIRLEALRDKSHTQNGLARSDSGNFVLTGFELLAGGQPIKLGSAEATFEQGPLKAATALDGNPQTGWAVHEGRIVDRPHTAVFRLAQPLTLKPDTKLTITLRHDSRHVSHNMGRFRLAVTDAASPSLGDTQQKLLELLRIDPSKRTADQAKQIATQFEQAVPAVVDLRAEEKKIREQIKSLSTSSVKVMVMQDMAKPRKTFTLSKGLYSQPKTEVSFGFPASLALPDSEESAPKSRLDLANWLVDPQHPLTARVTANRHWQKFFGQGLVKSTEDFGVQGRKPTHPQLLDALAAGLIASDWNIKALHKQIVMSATYRQSAKAPAELYQSDPENQHLARGPRSRLASWMIRDQALAVSSLLVQRIGGPSVKPYQPSGVWAEATFGKKRYAQGQGDDLYRRSLYTFWRRIVGPTMFFDVSKRQTCSVKTARTNTPLHALVTLNDITYVEAARALAQRVMLQHDDPAKRIETAFRLCTSRRPNADEISLLQGRLDILLKHFAADSNKATELLAIGESKTDPKLDKVQHASYASLCLMLLNLDETLSR